MRIIVFKPRLDVSFKEGPVPKERGPIIPLRLPWVKFVDLLESRLISLGHDVKVIELPLWRINYERIMKTVDEVDLYYIPHHSEQSFGAHPRFRFYMQMCIPEIFSIDHKGWCAGASHYPINPVDYTDDAAFNYFKKRIELNQSKFAQPSGEVFPKDVKELSDFIFFPCQLPHDQTIKYHSTVRVEQALEMTLEWAHSRNKTVIVKGHPANPGSMQPLFDICRKSKCSAIWIDNVSIHELIRKSKLVVCVNSGVGFETILHEKPIAIFGDADYDSVAYKISKDKFTTDLDNAYHSAPNVALYKRFMTAWYGTHFDTNNPETFNKIEDDTLCK